MPSALPMTRRGGPGSGLGSAFHKSQTQGWVGAYSDRVARMTGLQHGALGDPTRSSRKPVVRKTIDYNSAMVRQLAVRFCSRSSLSICEHSVHVEQSLRILNLDLVSIELGFQSRVYQRDHRDRPLIEPLSDYVREVCAIINTLILS